MKLKYAEKQSYWGKKSAAFLIDFNSNDIHLEAKNEGRNLQSKTAEFYQYYNFMLIYVYNAFMITWLLPGGFIDNASIFFLITEKIFYN